MLVSAIIMIITIIAVLCAVKKLRVWYAEPSGPVYTITVGKGGKINVPEPWRSNVDDDEEEDSSHSIPELTQGQTVKVNDLKLLASQTKPPSRYNEATFYSSTTCKCERQGC